MKKRIISVAVIMILVLGTYTVALADENGNATRNSLKSVGNVVYTDGENRVEIHSDDLYMLADKMDSFKECVADQLAQCHTYFSKGSKGTSTVSDSDIKVVHTQPSDSDAVDPVTLDFNTILEGIAASQSIPSDVTEYGYADGTALYKTESGELTTDGTLENVQQIDISAATPENLSAGSAAWVNGELILGTGADNNAYYQLGKVQSAYPRLLMTRQSYAGSVSSLTLYAYDIYETRGCQTMAINACYKDIEIYGSNAIPIDLYDSSKTYQAGTAVVTNTWGFTKIGTIAKKTEDSVNIGSYKYICVVSTGGNNRCSYTVVYE